MMLDALKVLLGASGLANLTAGNLLMLLIGAIMLYLAIIKKFEPLLLVPLGLGVILVNLPLSGIMEERGLLYLVYHAGVATELLPLIIFLGVGVLTDFGPMLANPITLLIGAAAQIGLFVTMLLAIVFRFDLSAACAIGSIGGADGPLAIYAAARLAPQILGPVTVAAYSYMALVPIIQPPIMRLLTSQAEREIRMKQLRPVSRREKILFPVMSTIFVGLVLPASVPIMGMLMSGNLLRECGVTERLRDTAGSALTNIATLFLGLAVGATMNAERFLRVQTLEILGLGLFAFAVSTAGGILFVKFLNLVKRGDPINPLIGSAGVSAVPMAARVSQTQGQKADPHNFLLMHAMGPNVAGVIGTTVVVSLFISLVG